MKGKKHGRSKHTIGQAQRNVFLVQFRIQAVGPAPCQGAKHRQMANADEKISWYVRGYQNADRIADLSAQGIERARMDQILWDEACREQDTIGVCVHFNINLCSACLIEAFKKHAGEQQLILAMLPARLLGAAFLIVSHRQTESAAIMAPFPADVEEKDILKRIRESGTYPIRLKNTETECP